MRSNSIKAVIQQREELEASRGQPIPVVDDEGHKVYHLVDADYLHISHEQLKRLIQEGMNSNHLPAEEVETELRRYPDRLASENAGSDCFGLPCYQISR